MFAPIFSGSTQQTTSYKVVLPFYTYAAISFVIATLLLLINTSIVQEHYFYPQTIAITHIMALGWGTMIILGASHQLLPVLVEGKLVSNLLAYLSFAFCAVGIPLLITGFYQFKTGLLMQSGATLANIGVACYVVNVFRSIYASKKFDIHAWYVGAAALWLFSTTFFGLFLVFNFNFSILPATSIAYLSLHAHLGIIGWFLLLIIGVGSRLIPMFLISKYTNNKTLWQIFILINFGLLSFLFLRLAGFETVFYYISIAPILAAIILFGNHCRKAFSVRIRKNVDEQMKASLFSVAQMLLPFIAIIIALAILPSDKHYSIVLLYGFCIFFGWITAIIFGMTFKTMPFIVWNKVYRDKAYKGKTPAPKELFNDNVFNIMFISYMVGFTVFAGGIVFQNDILLKAGSAALLISALLYAYNSTLVLLHQPKQS